MNLDNFRTDRPVKRLPPTTASSRTTRALAKVALALGLAGAFSLVGTATGTGAAIGATAPVSTLTYALVGAPTTGGFTVSTMTANAASVRLKVATNSALTSAAVYGAPAKPDASGWAKPAITGLAAGTRYYYGVEMTTAAGKTTTTASQGRPKTLSTGPASFTVAFGSCLKPGAGDTTAYSNLLAKSPDLFFHLGDLHYADNSSTSQASHLSDLQKALSGNAALRNILKAVPTLAIKSDHDSGGGNNALPGPYSAPNRAAYQQVFSTPRLTDTKALYWSFTEGRVKFIFTDHRYPRTSTSMMGAAQKDWFTKQLTSSEPVKVWVQDSTWNTRDAAEAGGDKWSDYPAEHAELGAYIAAHAVGQLISIHGDTHSISADNGSNNAWGGFPTFSAAPFRQTSSLKGGPWSNGRYPTSAGVLARQYGFMTVTDTGSTIAVKLSGYDSNNVARVTMTINVKTS
ncbi:MAG: alkaline phosphatase D family protein [Cellulomonas sp.]